MLKSTLIKATEAGGKVLKSYFQGEFKVSSKSGINDLVTEADLASEKAIFAVIKENFPDHFILSEEAGEIKMDSEYKWFIDPIDGTVNFANGIPLCCVSIGVEKGGEMVLGAVYNPILQEFYFAEKGQGATLNDTKIQVSDKADVTRACLVTGFPYSYLDTINGPLQVFERFVRQGIPIRRLGSAAMDLCWVAAGRFDGFYEHKLQPWDSAAGSLIVAEAGGRMSDFEGLDYSPYKHQVLATNGKIHEQMMDWIKGRN